MKIHYLFLQTKTRKKFHQPKKGHLQKKTKVNIIFNGERVCFHSKIRNVTGCPISLLFNIILGCLASAIR